MERISVTQAVRQFSDLLNRVSYQGQSFELERGNKVVARLSPATKTTKSIPIRELNQLFDELPDLLDDAEVFAADIKAVRENVLPESDPWA